MLRKLLFACAILCAPVIAHAQSVDARNPVFPGPNGVVIGTPSGGNMGQGTVNATGVYVNGQPVGGSISIPTASLLGGTGTALSGVTLGANLSLNAGVLSAAGGTPGGTSGQVQTNNGSGGFGALPVGQTGNSTILQTGSGGLIANSVLPFPTTSLPGGIIGLSGPSSGQFIQYIDTSGVQHLGTPAGGGNVSNSGTPTNGQLAQWINATGVQGVAATSFATTVNGTACSLTSSCTVPSAAGTLTGSALASGVTSSSLTSLAGGPVGTAAYANLNSMAITGGSISGVTGTLTGHSTLDLPLTGGTVSGLVTTQAGITDSGGINTTFAAGYSQNGISVFNANTQIAQATTVGGYLAGSSLPAGTQYVTAFGGSALASLTATHEDSAFGALACQLLVSGEFDTCIGQHAMGAETVASSSTALGNDSQRNWVSTTGQNTSAGKSAVEYGGANDTTALGFSALGGNSSSITLTGSPTATATLGLTFTGSYPGSPQTINVSVTNGESLATIASGIVSAIAANSTLATAPSEGVVGVVVDTNNVKLEWSGSSTTGTAIVVTNSTPVTGLTVTIGGGVTGSENLALGETAMLGTYMTTASFNIGMMKNSLYFLTSGTNNFAAGSNAGENCTTCSGSVFIGAGAGEDTTTAIGSIGIGTNAGLSETSSIIVAVGPSAGQNYTVGGGTFLGSGAGQNLTSGVFVTALGLNAANGASGSTASFLTAIGDGSLQKVASGAVGDTGLGHNTLQNVTTGQYNLALGDATASTTLTTGSDNIFICTGNTVCDATTASQSDTLTIQGHASTPFISATGIQSPVTSQIFFAGEVISGGGSAQLTAATTGFIHFPYVTAAPTGTPANVYGNACIINTATETLNCYIGSSWYHTTLTSGAG